MSNDSTDLATRLFYGLQGAGYGAYHRLARMRSDLPLGTGFEHR